jgi:hypothetical protein
MIHKNQYKKLKSKSEGFKRLVWVIHLFLLVPTECRPPRPFGKMGTLGKINKKTPLGKIGSIKNCAKTRENFPKFFFLEI